MKRIFISYSRRDLNFVKQLAKDLQQAGNQVWYDLSSLDGGDRWGREIQNAIRQSDVFLLVVSPNSVESEWVEKEFLYASNLQRRIIPLLYQACDLPLWLLNIHFVDVQGSNYAQNFPQVLRALTGEDADHTLVSAGRLGRGTVRPQPRSAAKGLNTQTAMLGLGALVIVCAMCAVMALLVNGNWSKVAAALFPDTSGSVTPVLPTDLIVPVTDTPATESPVPTTEVPADPTEAPTEPPETNEIADSKGIPMVLVPAGEFMMGSESGETDERPAHKVYLDAFYIDKFEVTNASYYLCEQNGICQGPYDPGSATRGSYYGNRAFNDFPVVNINWEQAKRFCEWRGGSLPTEAQWEKAARGTGQLTYPWGEGISCNYANIKGCVGDTTQVGTYDLGKSLYGAYDMTGNVAEWVADWYMNTFYAESPVENPLGPDAQYVYVKYAVLRGGSWGQEAYPARATARLPLTPGVGSATTGFRCVRPGP